MDFEFNVVPTAGELLEIRPEPEVIAIDVPIGLTDADRRECDCCARFALGSPRSTSVFPAPIRGALAATTREDACHMTEAADGRRVGVQAWGIFPKIREVDQLLRQTPGLQSRMREVHPEVSFWAWSGMQAMKDSKKTKEGKEARRRLVDTYFGLQAFDAARLSAARKQVADDDILDAFAALWTALRIWQGEARSLPETPPHDSAGLRMEIVY